MNPPSFSGQGTYEIVVQGHLDEQIGYWFEGLTLTTGFDNVGAPITTLSGHLVDQAALHGVLDTIRDINVPLISVHRIVVGPTDPRTTEDGARIRFDSEGQSQE
jgi:hypothetical protein